MIYRYTLKRMAPYQNLTLNTLSPSFFPPSPTFKTDTWFTTTSNPKISSSIFAATSFSPILEWHTYLTNLLCRPYLFAERSCTLNPNWLFKRRDTARSSGIYGPLASSSFSFSQERHHILAINDFRGFTRTLWMSVLSLLPYLLIILDQYHGGRGI